MFSWSHTCTCVFFFLIKLAVVTSQSSLLSQIFGQRSMADWQTCSFVFMASHYLSKCAVSRSTAVNVSRDVLRLHGFHFYTGVTIYGMRFHISFHISLMFCVKCLLLLFRQRLLHKHIVTSHQTSKYSFILQLF